MFIIVVEQTGCPMWILGKANTLQEAVKIVGKNTTDARCLTELLPGSCSSVVMQFVIDGYDSLLNICAI